jgi:hypothetical protein
MNESDIRDAISAPFNVMLYEPAERVAAELRSLGIPRGKVYTTRCRSLGRDFGIEGLERGQVLKRAKAAPSKKPFVKDCRQSLRTASILLVEGGQLVASLPSIENANLFLRKVRGNDQSLGGIKLIVCGSPSTACALANNPTSCVDRMDVRVVE